MRSSITHSTCSELNPPALEKVAQARGLTTAQFLRRLINDAVPWPETLFDRL